MNKDTKGDDGSVGEELLMGISEIELQCSAVEHAVRDNYFTLEEALKNYSVSKHEYINFLAKTTPRDSIESVFKAKFDYEVVNAFAREKFYEHFKDDQLQEGTWRGYSGFELLSLDKIEIKFSYGGGDMEFNDSFILDI